ncbi:Retrotransposon gag protein [Corchorus olitorius]|uniref:Retrotransposon gag protein n=1 Tax=Corchorus olitorius TaxID=93759 RepID=A0A1R3I4E5_9ROSI|nr:Retrotransposon gag protein [Corchorus olitorius]
MGEGVSTRLQKDVAQLKSEMEALGNQLRAEFRTDLQSELDAGLAKISSELKLTLEGFFHHRELPPPSTQGSPSNTSKSPMVDLTDSITKDSHHDSLRSFTKHSKLECPQFNGDDFVGWLSQIEQFFEADGTVENQKIRLVMLHMEGRALNWHQHFMRIKGTAPVSWIEYVLNMRSRFGSNEYFDPLSELVSLRQADDQTVDDFMINSNLS